MSSIDPALTDPTLDAGQKARAAASDANLAGIIAGRRKAARLLLATNLEPARQVRQDWEPIRQAETDDVIYRGDEIPQPRLGPSRGQKP